MAIKNILVDLNLNQNELQNAIIQNLPTNPGSPLEGQLWYRSDRHLVFFYDGTNAIPVGYLPPATAETLGGVKIGLNVDVAADGTISIKNASNTNKGVIRIATDAEYTGDAEDLAINPKQLNAAIATAQIGALIYKGTWDCSNPSGYASISLPVKKGWMYLVTGAKTTVGGIEWKAGDYLVFNKDIAAGGTITSSDVDKIDNTEADDIVRLAATQTLTNKTIDADNNTITNLETDNFKSGVIQTTVRDASTATDTSLATEKAVRTAIDGTVFTVTSPSMTPSSGVCTWTITNDIGRATVIASIRETSTGNEVLCDITYSASTITVKMNKAESVAAGFYTAVVLG